MRLKCTQARTSCGWSRRGRRTVPVGRTSVRKTRGPANSYFAGPPHLYPDGPRTCGMRAACRLAPVGTPDVLLLAGSRGPGGDPRAGALGLVDDARLEPRVVAVQRCGRDGIVGVVGVGPESLEQLPDPDPRLLAE